MTVRRPWNCESGIGSFTCYPASRIAYPVSRLINPAHRHEIHLVRRGLHHERIGFARPHIQRAVERTVELTRATRIQVMPTRRQRPFEDVAFGECARVPSVDPDIDRNIDP